MRIKFAKEIPPIKINAVKEAKCRQKGRIKIEYYFIDSNCRVCNREGKRYQNKIVCLTYK
jgi:hypothetical protein